MHARALEVKDDALAGLYDESEEQARLLLLFDSRYLGILQAVNEAVKSALRLDEFVLRDSDVERILLEAASRVVRIDATTRAKLQDLLAEGAMRGLSAWEVANGTADGSFGGIDRLFSETWRGRAELIARTELQHAANRAAVERYAASGLVGAVEAIDGDYDEVCAARNGRVYPLMQAPTLAHPACTLVLLPRLIGET